MIVWAVMDVWSLNHFHTQAPTLHEAYCTLHAAYSSSPESILKWDKRDLSPWRGGGGGGGAPPSTLDGHSWGEEVAQPPHLGWAQLGGVVHSPPWNGNSWGGAVHLPWSEGKLGVVDIQAFEARDGALCRKKALARLGGGGAPPLAWAGLEQGWGGWRTPPLAWMKVGAKWRTLVSRFLVRQRWGRGIPNLVTFARLPGPKFESLDYCVYI